MARWIGTTLGLWALGITLALSAAPPRDASAPPSSPAVLGMANDAQLADVTFADAQHGWAVGDRGVIFHTSDGGRQWTLQASGTQSRLASVFFLDDKIGWAAGGLTQPHIGATSGVLLHTRDGGAHWTLDRKSGLPALARVGFFDPQNGWAIGQPSAIFPSGACCTADGGRSWSTMPSTDSHGWLTGDFVDPQTGALGGRTSVLAMVRRREVESRPADYGLRTLRNLKLTPQGAGWLVGDGGLVLTTRDAGKTWQTPAADVPEGVRNQFDYSALAMRGKHVWVAGTPGTRILHSADGGQTWELQSTGQTLPIHALWFANDRLGWAVGDLGTILATVDGGKSWRVQRAGGARSALVSFCSQGTDIPLELIARLGADEGYLTAVELVNVPDPVAATSDDTDSLRTAHEASVLVGASAAGTAWRFPLRSQDLRFTAEQFVESWNQVNDGEAVDKLEAHVVARIRMWRPNVIVVPAADGRGSDPLAHLLNQLVLRSVERAADPKQFPELVALGLPAWKVQKVFSALPAGQHGTVTLNTAQLAPRIGRSVGELASAARAVMVTSSSTPPANLGFRLLVDHIPQSLGQRDFFSGIALSPGSDARRRYEEADEANLDVLRREAQMRRNLQAILAQSENDTEREGRFLADIGQQTRSLANDRAAEVLAHLAERYLRHGRTDLAAECYDMIAERYPEQPLAAAALVWLLQYYASGEAAWRERAGQQLLARQVSATAPLPEGRTEPQPIAGPLGIVRRGAATTAGATGGTGGGLIKHLQADGGQARLEQAAGYAKQIEQRHPALFAEPKVRFPLAVVQRQQGLPKQSQRFFLGQRHSRPHDAWWSCSQGELWLLEREGRPPKSLWNCVRSENKPRLDGRLNEPMWRAGNSVELASPQHDDTEWGAVAMLAYDEEFLYIGVSCTKAAACSYPTSDKPRPRDSDLSTFDRVELLIDLDRDYVTYYRLAIDQRGWTAENCGGAPTWNPNWFVAHTTDEKAWTAEAAIPLSELTSQKPSSGAVWAVGVQRTVPGVGFQSWTSPAAPQAIAEGFGLLLFQ